MAFTSKTWKDRISEYPNRRNLIDANNNSTTYTIQRNEGVITEQGDAFSASTMNDLESRISAEFTNLSTPTNTSSISSIITPASGVTINSAQFVQCGKLAQLYISWNYNKAITVPGTGNITNITVGTLVSGKRPKIPTAAKSNGDNAGPAWYSISTGGAVNLGACEGTGSSRTINAGVTFNLYTTYILA